MFISNWDIKDITNFSIRYRTIEKNKFPILDIMDFFSRVSTQVKAVVHTSKVRKPVN